MYKPWYSDYVRHMLRFYFRYNTPYFKTDVDRNNWNACHDVSVTYSKRDIDVLAVVYGGYDTLSDNVYEASVTYKVNQNIIWGMMDEFERKVACRRGLV